MKIDPIRSAEICKLDKASFKLLDFYYSRKTLGIHSTHAFTSNFQAFCSRFFPVIEILPNIECNLSSELRENLGTDIANRDRFIKIAIDFVH